MSDFGQLLVAFFAVMNPAAILLSARALGRDGRATPPLVAGAAALVAIAFVALFAGSSEQLLDALAIAPESFRVAAGIVMATFGVYAVVFARVPAARGDGTGRDALFPLGLPLLFGPPAMVAAVSYGADDGPGKTIAAAAVWLAVTVLLLFLALRIRPALPDAIARLSGALLVAVAAGLVVDGVRAI